MNVQASDYNVQSAEASVKEFQEDLRKTTIYAPMNGVVTGLYVEKGERVLGTTQMEGTDMMHIADLNAIEARVDVSENDVLRVKVGDTSVIKLDAYPDQKFKGVVTQIANSAKGSGGAAALTASDQVTNFVVKILLLPDSYAELMKTGSKRPPFLSGMSASVDIMTNTMHNIIAVPITSVTTRADTAKKDPTTKKKSNEDKQEIVFVPENGKVKAVKVVTGIEDDEYIEIKSGLNGDEQVVSAPYKAISTTLKDGSMIEVVSKDELFKEESK
jgi:HlyD family secretion protein